MAIDPDTLDQVAAIAQTANADAIAWYNGVSQKQPVIVPTATATGYNSAIIANNAFSQLFSSPLLLLVIGVILYLVFKS